MKIERSRPVRCLVTAGVLLTLSFLLQYTLCLPSFGKICPILFLTVAVACCGVFLGEWAGAVCGLAAGVCADAVSAAGSCYHTLFYLLLGCACGLLIRYLLNARLPTVLLLSAGAVALDLALSWVIFSLLPGVEFWSRTLLLRWVRTLFWSSLYALALYFPLRRLMRGWEAGYRE